MMIKARHHWFYVPLFCRFTRRNFRKIYHQVSVIREPETYDQALFLMGNHFSWWDGFFAYYLNMEIFHKQYHVMMLEEQLQKNRILNKIGAYSIQPGSRHIRESLMYTRDLLKDPQNLVVFYPQGKIESMHTQPLHFESGMEMILKGLENVQVVFYAALIDYFSQKKPGLNLYLNTYRGERTTEKLEEAYNSFLSQCKIRQTP